MNKDKEIDAFRRFLKMQYTADMTPTQWYLVLEALEKELDKFISDAFIDIENGYQADVEGPYDPDTYPDIVD